MSISTQDSGWDLPGPHVVDISVDDTVIDGLGHAHNTAYVRWCEQASWGHSNALGITLDTYHELRRAMVIRQTSYEYLMAAYLGDTVAAATWVVACDEVIRVVRRFQLRRVSDGATLLRGRTEFVCINLDSGRATRMPALFASTYGGAAVDDSGMPGPRR